MIDRKDKVFLKSVLHHMTGAELQTLSEVLEYEWVFDDASPKAEQLAAAIRKEQYERKLRPHPPRLVDNDRRVLRMNEEKWEQIARPILVDAGITIVEIGSYEYSKYRTDGTSN